MKKGEIENINHCIIRFYHNQWYKEDNSPQYAHKLIPTGELEIRERLYNKVSKEVEYNEEFNITRSSKNFVTLYLRVTYPLILPKNI